MSDYPLQTHELTANTIRGLAMDAVQAANSGHPGLPMGMADAAVVLWSQLLRFNPLDPAWPNRDRFVLSAGHGSMLLYALLHLSGYDLPMSDLKQFRQWDSLTPGHPENHLTPGVETTTGPLGQGLANAVGMALAERWLATRFNRPGYPIVDHSTYVIASDGDLMEGISHEVCSLAGHLALGKLIVLYDDNEISIDGPTDLAFTEDAVARFAAYGWHTARIDGHDPLAVLGALRAAVADASRPSLIACRTTIGYGSPNKAGTAKAHGEPLGEEEIRLTKAELGLPVDEPFYVAPEARAVLEAAGRAGAEAQAAWQDLWQGYAAHHPALAAELERSWAGVWTAEVEPSTFFDLDKPVATRAASGVVLNEFARQVPALLGGSADLTPSNKTDLKGEADLKPDDFSGRYIRFGVREHGMGGILNGMALHGGIRPYGGTFLVFSDYMRPSIRLAAIMGLPVIYVFTHDSIGVGEDGPTHQPVEQAMSLRLIPNLTVYRPADPLETAAAWEMAINRTGGPTALLLTRQSLPYVGGSQEGARRGGYVLSEAGAADPDAILIASGSELHLAAAAQATLAKDGIQARVVSMPSWEVFAEQPAEYQAAVLPARVQARVSIEAGVTLGWQRYVGPAGASVGVDRFGASAPYKTIFEQLGVTSEALVEATRRTVAATAA